MSYPLSVTLRADSARVRAQMLQVARERLRDGDLELPMNAIAKAAGVGVGTVYRHFPTRQVLLEALAEESFASLVADARASSADPDTAGALARLLGAGLRMLRDDPSLGAVLGSTGPECPETIKLGGELEAALSDLLVRARAEGVIRPDITADDLRRLICGIQHAAAVGAGDPTGRYLQIILAGLKP
jgi:AcrR family transcriptional regulator